MVLRVRTRSVAALTAMILAVLLFGMPTRAQGPNPPGRDYPDIQLPSHARGAAALGALAPHLPEIAAQHGKSTDELRSIFLRDNTIWTDVRGRLYYGCEFGPPPVRTPGGHDTRRLVDGNQSAASTGFHFH